MQLGSFGMLAAAVGVVGLVFALFVLVPRLFAKGMRDSLEGRLKERYPDASRLRYAEYSASCYGVLSEGDTRWSGSGCLAVSDRELCFFQFMHDAPLFLSLSRITAVKVTERELAPGKATKLLHVEYTGKAGPGAIAFWVPRPEELKALLDRERGG